MWDIAAFQDFLLKAHEYLNQAFEIVRFEQNDTEIIAILKKSSNGVFGKIKLKLYLILRAAQIWRGAKTALESLCKIQAKTSRETGSEVAFSSQKGVAS